MNREEAIKILKETLYDEKTPTDYLEAVKKGREALENQKTGRWKKISPAGIYECTECGQNVMTGDIECYKFCHGCGASMKGE